MTHHQHFVEDVLAHVGRAVLVVVSDHRVAVFLVERVDAAVTLAERQAQHTHLTATGVISNYYWISAVGWLTGIQGQNGQRWGQFAPNRHRSNTKTILRPNLTSVRNWGVVRQVVWLETHQTEGRTDKLYSRYSQCVYAILFSNRDIRTLAKTVHIVISRNYFLRFHITKQNCMSRSVIRVECTRDPRMTNAGLWVSCLTEGRRLAGSGLQLSLSSRKLSIIWASCKHSQHPSRYAASDEI